MVLDERGRSGHCDRGRWPTTTDLVTLPCYDVAAHAWSCPPGTRLLRPKEPHLAGGSGSASPLITYHPSFTGRTRIDAAFAQKLACIPRIALEAIDSDVIKTYVRSGLGVGIVAEMATRDEPAGGDLVARPVGHLFRRQRRPRAFKRGAYLRSFVITFAELLSERLTRALILKAMTGNSLAADDPAL